MNIFSINSVQAQWQAFIFENETNKSRLRTTILQNRLSYLSLLRIESDLLRELDFTDIIDDFVAKKASKVSFA